MSHIGIVPARGSSRRIPRKNIRLCAGKPLLSWTAEAALCSRLDRVILSTDDEEIASIGRECGLEVPMLRPKTLADDGAAMLPVLRHLVNRLEGQGTTVQTLTLLQPTSPLRLARHIDEALELFIVKNAETVVSVSKITSNSGPEKFMRIAENGTVTAAGTSSEGMVMRNGPAILITTPDVLARDTLYGNPTYAYAMDREFSVDIDDEYDFTLAELLLHRRSDRI